MTDPDPRPHSSGPNRSELTLRILSAAVLAPLALAGTYVGGWAFALGVGACALWLVWEWAVIAGALRQGRGMALATLVGVLPALVLAVATGQAALATPVLAITAGGVALAGVMTGRTLWTWLAGGMLYGGLLGVVLIDLRAGSHGLAMVFFLFAVVWATDIAAYFAGRSIGGPKLWPRVSPKKTWSGALGGLAAAIAVGAAASALDHGVSPLFWIPAAAVLSVFSQAGDLFESSLKRHFGVKDSGHVIPGHGGIMDRLDGLAGAGILGYLVAVVVSGSLVDPVYRLMTAQGY